jgi:hypothetical protein
MFKVISLLQLKPQSPERLAKSIILYLLSTVGPLRADQQRRAKSKMTIYLFLKILDFESIAVNSFGAAYAMNKIAYKMREPITDTKQTKKASRQ